MRPFLPARVLAAWAAALLFVCLLIGLTGFTSEDPDSALHAALSARLAELPVAQWIAPEWWGEWDSEGLYREHPAGIFLVPVLLAQAGVPAVQASYMVGVAAGLAALLLLGTLVTRVAGPAAGWAVLSLLQVMPVAFIFRIRANHEYPMLVCLLLALVAIDGVQRSWKWAPVLAVALTTALLVKGAFIVLVLAGAGLWILVDPARRRASLARLALALALSAGVVAVVAWAYDLAYLHATGQRFWWPYWQRQMGPLEVATPFDNAAMLASHMGFYLVRLLWHPAPWSLAIAGAVWVWRGRLRDVWRGASPGARRGVVFALGFAAASVVILSPASRFAERYAFSASFAVGTCGAVVALALWPRLGAWLERQHQARPALPVWIWTALMLARLVVGPLLPRVQ
ncbi:MAG: glycosyltransferase family 39 protein [Vicinamibacterales bacterium]